MSCVVESRGKEVHREAESRDGRRKRWRRQWGEKREACQMTERIRDREEQPPTGKAPVWP